MSQLLTALPVAELQPWIHSYRLYNFVAAPASSLRLYPGTGAELWLTRHDQQGSGLLYQRGRAMELARPHGPVFAIRFRAGALAAFCELSLHEFVDAFLPPTALWPDSRQQLLRIQRSDAFAEQCQLSDRQLLSQLRDQHGAASSLLARQIFQQPATFRIGEHAEQIGMHRSQLSRQFHAQQGVSAKHYQRLCRFERFLRAASFSRGCSLCELAHAHGFYDQAHMNREVRLFSGARPTQLAEHTDTPLFYSPLAGAS
ncbi:helix-turn-helix domain-containing protein [Chitinilyticum litopenaei]|uniref:helix-turn-helix domain-containing protein n=1 Tax=Chitinilyticum litopenaei TaxID=1121276 RepID=UPI0004103797|nr:helix-turn-helix domain-containing protein [Chitinilyticum litopenaei]